MASQLCDAREGGWPGGKTGQKDKTGQEEGAGTEARPGVEKEDHAVPVVVQNPGRLQTTARVGNKVPRVPWVGGGR